MIDSLRGSSDGISSQIGPLSAHVGTLSGQIGTLGSQVQTLQEELAARVAESTGRNLYVLAILTAVFLPMTLITGIFGMNVAGLPGLHDAGSFWWVMVLIGLGGAATLAAIFWRKRD